MKLHEEVHPVDLLVAREPNSPAGKVKLKDVQKFVADREVQLVFEDLAQIGEHNYLDHTYLLILLIVTKLLKKNKEKRTPTIFGLGPKKVPHSNNHSRNLKNCGKTLEIEIRRRVRIRVLRHRKG